MTERPTPIVPSRAELEAEVGAKSGFEEGIAFAVKAIRERASLISGPEEPYSEAWVVLQKIADDLESASVPQWLVLPLVWKPDPQDPRLHDLYLGPYHVGTVFHWTEDDLWKAEGTGLVGHCSSHPTKELAQAALVEAVMALNKGTDNG